MPLTPSLQRFVDDELQRANGLLERTLTAANESLRKPRDETLSPAERQHAAIVSAELHRHRNAFVQAFVASLKEIVLENLQGLAEQATGGMAFAPTLGLQLMDEKRVESDVELSRAAQIIDSAAEWELRELATFTSTLAGQQHVSSQSNPLQPLAYARALWSATAHVSTVFAQRALLLRTLSPLLGQQLKLACAGACTRLEEQGIEPGIYRTVIVAPNAPHAPQFDVTRPGALEDLRSAMPANRPPPAPARPAAAPAPSDTTISGSLQGALDRTRPMGMPSAAGAMSSDRVDRQIVELVTRLFESMLRDSQLPVAARAVVARLQASALRIALLDPQMLDDHNHPLWDLVNRIGVAAAAYPAAGDPRKTELMGFCESLVDALSRSSAANAEGFRRAIHQLDQFLASQLRAQRQAAQPTIDALERAERCDELERELSQRLEDQLLTLRVTDSLRRFLTGLWARVLAQAVVQHGAEAAQTVQYTRIVDELLGVMRVSDDRSRANKLGDLKPRLMHELRQGLASIQTPDDEQQSLLQDIDSLLEQMRQPGHGSAELTPQEIVQRMRAEPTTDMPARDTAPLPFHDSLIALGSLDAESTAPGAMHTDDSAPDDPVRYVNAMQLGERFRLFLHGQWSHMQLLWRSKGGRYLLFAGEAPSRTHSITRRALSRLRDEKLVQPPESASLLQRAVDRMMRDMGALTAEADL